MRPAELDYTRPDRTAGSYDRSPYSADDALFLWLLFVIGVTGFLVEGLRLAADRPPWEPWSVVGWQLANGFEALGITPAEGAVLGRRIARQSLGPFAVDSSRW